MNRVIVAVVCVVLTSLLGGFISLVVGSGVYVITTNLKKSDSSEKTVTELSLKMGTFQTQMMEMASTIKDIRLTQNNSRVDPFTGRMGLTLQKEMLSDLDDEVGKVTEKFKEDIDDLEEDTKDKLEKISDKLNGIDARLNTLTDGPAKR